MSEAVQVHKGLEGVVADSTAVSLVDGEAGRLYYRGQPVESLVRHPFAAVMHLVVFGELPDATRLAETEEYLWQAGHLPPQIATSLREIARHGLHPMATLQAITPLLAVDPPSLQLGRTADEEEGLDSLNLFISVSLIVFMRGFLAVEPDLMGFNPPFGECLKSCCWGKG